MQIVSLGDNLHEMQNPISAKKIRKMLLICRLLNLPIASYMSKKYYTFPLCFSIKNMLFGFTQQH